jgi:hypothetical protein
VHFGGYCLQFIAYFVYLSAGTHGVPSLSVIYGAIWIFYAVLTLVYGWGDMSSHKPRGPYKIGAKELNLTDFKCLVFYPIDNSEYVAGIKKKPFKYYRFKDANAFTKAKKSSLGKCWPPAFLFKG